MKRDWVKGWNGGLTGPNTPNAPTVSCRAMQDSHLYIPIASGTDTVAIAVGPDREETATLIAKAPRMEDALKDLLALAHPTLDKMFIEIIKEALR